MVWNNSFFEVRFPKHWTALHNTFSDIRASSQKYRHFTINTALNYIHPPQVPHLSSWFILLILFIWKQAREILKQMLLQLCVHVRLFSQYTPQKEADGNQAGREDLPPGELLVAPKRVFNCPDSVTGFAGGELHGLTLHLNFFICGLSWSLRAQS